MNEELATLKVKIEAITAPFKKDMDKVRQIAHSTSTDTEKSMRKIKNPIKAFTAAKRDFQINAGIKVPTEEYEKVNREIQKVEQALKQLRAEERALQQMGKLKVFRRNMKN